MPQAQHKRIGELDTIIVTEGDHEIKVCVILCHGYGASAQSLAGICLPFFESTESMKHVAFLFPQAPIDLDPSFDAYAWWPLDMDRIQQMVDAGTHRELKGESPERLPVSAAMVQLVIEDAMKTHSLERTKIVIGGFSQGAMMATHIALTSEPVGGVIAWSGALINEAQWRPIAQTHAPLAIVQSHGTEDPILPFANAVELRDMLQNANHQVSFVKFDGPHTVPDPAIDAAIELVAKVLAS